MEVPQTSVGAARRVAALIRHLQPASVLAADDSAFRVTAAHVLGLTAGQEGFSSLSFDWQEENMEPSITKNRVNETWGSGIKPSKIIEGRTNKTEPWINSQLTHELGCIRREVTAEGGMKAEARGHQEVPREKVILIVGAGDATGGAVAKRFTKEGYVACLVRRHKEKLKPLADEIIAVGGQAHSFGVDARKEEEMVALVEQIEREIGEIQVAVFNIGANVQFPILETTSRVYTKVWEMACFAGFLTGREAAKRMVPRKQGTIIFTGATASMRGGSGFSAFAGAKFALRGLAQSMARELGPKGVHVSHVIIDAAINTAWTRENFDNFDSRIKEDGVVQPGDIADLYWHLHQQPKRAWTHEVDLRPHNEPW